MANNNPLSLSMYQKLDLNRQEIRLLTLRTAPSIDEQPRCDIEVVSLQHERPDFFALSYVWGDGKDRKDILLHDCPYRVTANLDLALRYLQCIPDLARIWIDAICINQLDKSEKGQQVGIMSEIYARARKTYMWMGGPVYFSNVAIDSIRSIKSIPRTSWGNARIFAVKQLIERPYWTRVWVVQEAFYSRHAIVKCGHDEVDFERFYDLADFIQFHNNLPRTARCPERPDQNLIRFTKFPFRLLFRLCAQDRNKSTPIRIDMFRWLNYTDSFSSTLPRDRFFAFLNLSFVTDQRFIRPDYSDETSNRYIFSEVTAYFLRSRSPTKYLLPLQLRQVGKMLPDLPSWVPDWTVPPHHDQIITAPTAPLHCAGQDDSAWERLCPGIEPLGFDIQERAVQFRFSADFEVLTIRGVVIDKISSAISVADGDNLARKPDFRKRGWSFAQRQVFEACQIWEAKAFASDCNAFNSDNTVSGLPDAIWRTMMTDKEPDGTSPANPEFYHCFTQWKTAVAEGNTAATPAALVSNDPKLLGFDSHVVTLAELRAYCVTERGRVGLVPSITREGDLVCVFQDGRVPFILREEEGKEGIYYRWIGEAYIHGVMFGDGLREAAETDMRLFTVK